MRVATICLLGVACSSPPVKPANPPASCPVADRGANAYAARRSTIGTVVGKGREFEWKLEAPLDAVAARATCKDESEDLRILCFEGIAQGYGSALAKQGASEAALRESTAQLARIDESSSVIYCRGLGAGLHAGGMTTDKLAPLIAGLDARCKDGIADGFSTRSYMAASPKATTAFVEAIKLDDACAGLEARWCAFGAGRALAHMFPGDPASAAHGCQGAQRRACLSGIAYVTTYFYDRDDLGYTTTRVAAFAGDDRAGYMAGAGSALQWLKRSNHLEHRLACLQGADRALVQRIQSTAEACGAFDFTDGANCRWEAL